MGKIKAYSNKPDKAKLKSRNLTNVNRQNKTNYLRTKPNAKAKLLINNESNMHKTITSTYQRENVLHTTHGLTNLHKTKDLNNEEIPKELIKKFSRGEGLKGNGIRTNFNKIKFQNSEKIVEWATEQAARSTILQTEQSGFFEPEENEVTRQFNQTQIARNVDITSAAKQFELNLEFGPYRMNYTRNGRFLLLGGRRGHLASVDWVTKQLLCETNVMEQIFDVQWLHQETMFAVAQKDWVYMYDNKGVELHCVKPLNRVVHMEFLPYHFLLATGNEDGFLGWLDISIGKLISHYNNKQGRLKVMTQNPSNAIITLGHTNGTVTMWSPNMREPLVKMLCHKQGITSLAIDQLGRHMVTAAVDRSVRIWDVRHLVGPLQDYRMHSIVSNVAFSQKGLVATSSGNIVEVYNDLSIDGQSEKRPYLRQKLYKAVENLQFCPFEDVLGAGTYNGFSSLLIPGSGEPNFDAFEANPFQSKSQRREAEVKALLEKIQPEMITLDPSLITDVDLPSLKDKLESKKSLLFVKPPKVDFTPRKKKKRNGRSVKMTKTKKILKEEGKREFLKAVKEKQGLGKDKAQQPERPGGVLDRFKLKYNTKNTT